MSKIDAETQQIIIDFSGGVPEEFDACKLIKNPRKQYDQNIVKKGYKFIKSLYR
jgi:hypothetical protein